MRMMKSESVGPQIAASTVRPIPDATRSVVTSLRMIDIVRPDDLDRLRAQVNAVMTEKTMSYTARLVGVDANDLDEIYCVIEAHENDPLEPMNPVLTMSGQPALMIESQIIPPRWAMPIMPDTRWNPEQWDTLIYDAVAQHVNIQTSILIAGRNGGASKEFSQSVAGKVSYLLTPGIPLPVVRFDEDECEFHFLWLHRGCRVEISVPENDDVFIHAFGLSDPPESTFYKDLPKEHVRSLLVQLYGE